MDVVIGLLIAWSLGKARRVGMRVNGLTDQALDLAVDRVWNVVAAKLGTDQTLARLIAEGRTGVVSPETRADAERTLGAAADSDPMFAAALVEAAAGPGGAPPVLSTQQFAGVSFGSIDSGGGSVDIRNESKIVNYARQHPAIAVIAVVVVVILAGLLVGQLAGKGPPTAAEPATGDVTTAVAPSPEPAPKANPRVDASAMVGTWSASDGTGTKTFNGSGGSCDGLYYHQGKPLDIGGPSTCVLSGKPDATGRYTLVVTQSVNRASYKVEFTSADHALVYDSAGTRLYELERF
ncbi:hypothetical protein AB0M22_31375 [Nocardia sp. NPDC051756]|uniref:hypothetical protein n=1 Tax=Nocardia sp. NPDC051756 TaxID=3154751 RepID=UPI0034134BAD